MFVLKVCNPSQRGQAKRHSIPCVVLKYDIYTFAFEGRLRNKVALQNSAAQQPAQALRRAPPPPFYDNGC